jgi:Spy/CpxP family protein refolding chaperone
MKKIVNALLIAACGVVLVSASQAQKPSSTNMDILRQKVKADRKLLVATNLALTEAEGKAFWPVYDAYQTELTAINQRTLKLVNSYATAYNAGPITDQAAKPLLTEMMAIDEAELKLRQSYLPKFESVLPATKVARYVQIENKIRAVVKYELAANIPFIE